MEAIIFCGIQATGKTTFYVQRFLNTHVRISMDLLNTRNKERIFIETCLHTRQRFVVDNTNPTRKARERYISRAREARYRVIGYYFRSDPEEVAIRNQTRNDKKPIPTAGIRGTAKRLEIPAWQEGFDELYYVYIDRQEFVVEPFSAA